MNKDKPFRVAVYCRCARENDEAISRQLERASRFAISCGYNDVTSYVDNGYSGLSMNRRGLDDLERDIESGKVHTIVVTDIARIARSYLALNEWLNKMEFKGIKVLCVDGTQFPIKNSQQLVQMFKI